MIDNTDEYIALMRDRAQGLLPDMGCALRVGGLIREMHARLVDAQRPVDVLDVGCATGHFFRTFLRQELAIGKYVGLEIDAGMLNAAREVWSEQLASGAVEFINEDLERFSSGTKFDFVICVNAFMYFGSAKAALANLMKAARRHLLIRSYFADSNYRIVRGQSKRNHDKSTVEEVDIFDEAGNMICYDFWNIYSFTYIEALVRQIEPDAKVDWIEDRNIVSSMEQERQLNIQKRGATEVLDGHEISYPFILPWKYLSITMGAR